MRAACCLSLTLLIPFIAGCPRPEQRYVTVSRGRILACNDERLIVGRVEHDGDYRTADPRIALSCDGLLAMASAKDLAVYDLKRGGRLAVVENVNPWAVAWSPDGKQLVAALFEPQEPLKLTVFEPDLTLRRTLSTSMAPGYNDITLSWGAEPPLIVVSDDRTWFSNGVGDCEVIDPVTAEITEWPDLIDVHFVGANRVVASDPREPDRPALYQITDDGRLERIRYLRGGRIVGAGPNYVLTIAAALRPFTLLTVEGHLALFDGEGRFLGRYPAFENLRGSFALDVCDAVDTSHAEVAE
ncbi:MAG: hypothetical protein KDA32_04435 [Phycisphaerales bacterium]|nr:hypothetical protein [Phycisphaerales bacterium]